MKKILSLLLMFVMLFNSSMVFAQQQPSALPPATVSLPPFEQLVQLGSTNNRGRISPMRAGQTAPFDGVLFDTQASATISAERQFMAQQCSIYVTREVETARNEARLTQSNADARIAALTAERSIMVESRTREVERLTTALRDSEERSTSFFNARGMFWLGIGVLSTGAVIGAIYLGLALSSR